MVQTTIPELFKAGLSAREAGDLRLAETKFREILSHDPQHAHTLHMLAMTLSSQDRFSEAQRYARQALEIDSSVPMFHYTLGNILIAEERLDEAVDAFNKALRRKAEFADCLNNKGLILHRLGRHEEALESFLALLRYRPDYTDAHSSIANIYRDLGKFDQALEHYYNALSQKPEAKTYANIGFILQERGDYQGTIAVYQKALKLDTDLFPVLNNMGVIHNEIADYAQAIHYYQRALVVQPKNAETMSNLANALRNIGRISESVSMLEQAVELDPNNVNTFSNLLLAMIYDPSVSPEILTRKAIEYGEKHGQPHRQKRLLNPDKTPLRKLKIGYVSPDFREHAVNYFFENLLDHHDRMNFEIYAYSNNQRDDNITERLKKKFDHWHDIRFMNDDKASDLIEDHKIDILIDLAGHTGRNRLGIFARKPAPVQVTWLGYPGTTGLKAIDYRITDAYAEPKGMTEVYNVETLWRLPHMFCCYGGSIRYPTPIDHPPFEDNGFVTFGCFNNFARVTNPTLEVWGRILKAVPESRLLLEILGIEKEDVRKPIEKRLLELGIPPDQLILEPRKKSNQFVLYNRVDIALDPFPCSGGTNSADAVYMGAPLITLAGNHFLSRLGVTILTNIGLPELITENIDAYIAKAIELAHDRDKLKSIRHKLHERVAASPMCNSALFATNMESAYREMWKIYCNASD